VVAICGPTGRNPASRRSSLADSARVADQIDTLAGPASLTAARSKSACTSLREPSQSTILISDPSPRTGACKTNRNSVWGELNIRKTELNVNPSTLRPEGRSLLRIDPERPFVPALKSRAWRSRGVKKRGHSIGAGCPRFKPLRNPCQALLLPASLQGVVSAAITFGLLILLWPVGFLHVRDNSEGVSRRDLLTDFSLFLRLLS